MGCDKHLRRYVRSYAHFNPRSPSGLRQQIEAARRAGGGFQSTQPEWAATGAVLANTVYKDGISIHAARVGCDYRSQNDVIHTIISIHAARVGCDVADCQRIYAETISIHAARVGCDNRLYNNWHINFGISIHAARVGCDRRRRRNNLTNNRFQSTQPEWAATSSYCSPITLPVFQSTQPEWAATKTGRR